uniref:AlNc14C527G12052 protein n=1 Tax=Albugo laibachii Nc14 TaxID=890382 RepID=F0X0W2_9STRA|nr:AlNc14C527G12052 [Albugo laibachii Nc14]|eukprot:CCA27407.1 AlNc14C527G12052 [Albugo laibachii Nc14]
MVVIKCGTVPPLIHQFFGERDWDRLTSNVLLEWGFYVPTRPGYKIAAAILVLAHSRASLQCVQMKTTPKVLHVR